VTAPDWSVPGGGVVPPPGGGGAPQPAEGGLLPPPWSQTPPQQQPATQPLFTSTDKTHQCEANTVRKKKIKIVSSVPDPKHYGTDADPEFEIRPLRIRILTRFQNVRRAHMSCKF
jgi:hypothetical protein